MLRFLVVGCLCLAPFGTRFTVARAPETGAASGAIDWQLPGPNDGRVALQVRIAVPASGGEPTPVPRHLLLVSDNPPTAPPRRLMTAADGTATVRLPPGSYTIESDQPVTFQGKSYQWIQTVDLAPGRDVLLDSGAGNAEVGDAAPVTADSSTSLEADPSSVLIRWQDSVVAVWTPTARASGFVVDPRGLVVTSQQAVGSASTVEVEVTPARKVAGRVLAADAARGVAVVRIDAGAAASMAAVPLACGAGGRAALAEGQPLVAVGAPFRRSKTASGAVIRGIEGRIIAADFVLGTGSTGGPVFAADGRVVGISAPAGTDDGRRDSEAQVVRIEEVCAVLAAAETALSEIAAPPSVPLPVEPNRPFPAGALSAAAATPPALDRYRLASSSYDVTFITPRLLNAARQHAARRGRGGATVRPSIRARSIRSTTSPTGRCSSRIRPRCCWSA